MFYTGACAGTAQFRKLVVVNSEATELQAKGRYDPCVVPRAVPIVEAMTALVLADHWLRRRMAKL